MRRRTDDSYSRTMTETRRSAPLTLDPIKSKHRAMWALGNYDNVATEVIQDLGPRIVEAAGVAPGDQVLDVAAGSGNASLPAARAGGQVVATDLTPELLQTGRQRAESAGLDITWQEADAEHLPFDDGRFDTVLSLVGVMFAPFHQPVADELLRVTRAGGTIALVNWTPQGFIGQMFATMKPYAPAPPPGASPGPLWGTEDHVRELFGDRVSSLTATREDCDFRRFTTGTELRDYFKSNYGPTIAAYRNIADDPAKVDALDQALADLGDRHITDGHLPAEYLLVVATRA
jgi:ubiquinone/menaquinone biosynthesis C-methylase UbiE